MDPSLPTEAQRARLFWAVFACLLALICSACEQKPNPGQSAKTLGGDAKTPEKAVLEFLTALKAGDVASAAKLYQHSYDPERPFRLEEHPRFPEFKILSASEIKPSDVPAGVDLNARNTSYWRPGNVRVFAGVHGPEANKPWVQYVFFTREFGAKWKVVEYTWIGDENQPQMK